jgi:hypothetical protein
MDEYEKTTRHVYVRTRVRRDPLDSAVRSPRFAFTGQSLCESSNPSEAGLQSHRIRSEALQHSMSKSSDQLQDVVARCDPAVGCDIPRRDKRSWENTIQHPARRFGRTVWIMYIRQVCETKLSLRANVRTANQFIEELPKQVCRRLCVFRERIKSWKTSDSVRLLVGT